MAKKNKGKIFVPGNCFDQADQDYKNLLPKDMADKWITQFNAEYYSNDHHKEDSIFRENLPGYDVDLIDIDGKGKPITMKQKLFGLTNSRNRCIFGDAYFKKKLEDIDDHKNIPEEEIVMSIDQKIEEQLEFFSPKQILDQLKREALTEIEMEPNEKDLTLEWLTQATMILALKSIKTNNKKKKKKVKG